jgi:hypothetical protein
MDLFYLIGRARGGFDGSESIASIEAASCASMTGCRGHVGSPEGGWITSSSPLGFSIEKDGDHFSRNKTKQNKTKMIIMQARGRG